MASRPSQSPKLDSDIDSHSLRKSRTRSTARSFATRPTPPMPSRGTAASGVVARRRRVHRRGARVRVSSSVNGAAASARHRSAGGRQAVRRRGGPLDRLRPPRRRAAAPGASGRTESGLPGSEERGGAAPAGSRYRARVTKPAAFRPHGERRAAARPPGAGLAMARVGPRDGRRRAGRRSARGTSARRAAWDPVGYRRFADERARPFLDLVARLGAQPRGSSSTSGAARAR